MRDLCGARIPAVSRLCRGALALALLAGACFSSADRWQAQAAVAQQYYKIDRLVVPVIRRRGLEGHIFLIVYLELTDTKYRPDVAAKMPKLRDEYIRLLNRYIAHRPRILHKLRLKELKSLLFRATESVMGEGKVKAVLIQAAVNRRLK